MVNKKQIALFLGVIALSGVFHGCLKDIYGKTLTGPPSINYSLIGPYDSAILFYVDSSLSASNKKIGKRFFYIKINPGNLSSEYLVNWEGVVFQKQQCQILVPNGSFTLHVEGQKEHGPPSDILPIDVSINDMAITYKIRLATDEEKRAGGLGLGNDAYMLEEVSQVKLR